MGRGPPASERSVRRFARGVSPYKPTHANGVTYDTGALIAADRGVRAFWLRHEGFLRAGVVPTVPTVVLAQAWRSARQVALARLLTGCVLEELSAVQARAVGLLAARSGHADVVDLAVAEGALRRGDLVLTSDPDDIARAGGSRLILARL